MGNQPGKGKGPQLPFSKPKQNFGGGQATGYKTAPAPSKPAAAPPCGNAPGGSGGAAQSRLLGIHPPRPATNPRFTGGGVSGTRPAAGDGRSAEEREVERAFVKAQAEEMELLLLSVEDAPIDLLLPALELLHKIFAVVIDKPADPKVRRIRWNNAKVQQHLANVPIAQDFLVAAGFTIASEPIEGSTEQEDVMRFEDGRPLLLMTEARRLVAAALLKAKQRRDASPAALAAQARAGTTPAAAPTAGASAEAEGQLIDLAAEGGEGPAADAHAAGAAEAAGGSPAPAAGASPSASLPAGATPGGTLHEEGSEVGQDAEARTWGGARSETEDKMAALGLQGGGGAGAAEEERLGRMHGLIGTLDGADPALLVPALDVVVRIAAGILDNSASDKMRRVRRGGAAFGKVEAFASLLELLEAGGFVFCEEDGDRVVRFPAGASLHLLGELRSMAAQMLRRLKPKDEAGPGPAAAAPAARETKVFFKSAGGEDPARFSVPDSYFALSGAELKALTASRQGDALMTKTMREAARPKFRFALLRVRFPDGMVLQGKFRPDEPAAALQAWVRGCVSAPDRHFYLSTMPPVTRATDPAHASKSLAELSLVPAALLNFFWTDGINDVGPFIAPHLASTAVELRAETLPEQVGGARPARAAGDAAPRADPERAPAWLPQGR